MADDDERAAKAARAKAMLKKRQQKKAATGAPSDVTSPIISPPPSRTFTPAPADPVEEKHDLGDVFDVSKDDPSATSWLSSLTRVPSPPPPAPPVQEKSLPPQNNINNTPAPPKRTSLTSPPLPSGKDAALQKQLSALQADNEALAADVARLKAFESQTQQADALLQESRAATQVLEDLVQRLQADNEALQQNQQQTISLLVSEKASLASELERLEGVENLARTTEASLEEERRIAKDLDEQVRRLRAEASDSAARIQQSESKEKELTEKCREQERELQRVNASIHESKKEAERHQKAVRELKEQIQSDDRLERAENSLKNTQNRADELEFQLSKLKQAHSTLKTERDGFDADLRTLRESEEKWQAKHLLLQQEHSTTQQHLASTTSEKEALSQEKSSLQLELNEKLLQLQTTQNELKAANRRAEEAEQTQKDLQSEGTTLMRSLDEMRPKIVELTGVKLELGEKVDGLEHSLRSRDTKIGQLEAELDELHDQKDQADQRVEEDRSLAQASSGELQKAYADLREELDLSNDTNHRQESVKRMEEIERLTAASNAQLDELTALQQEDEEQDFLARAQNEIESLHEEIERLREAVSSPAKEDPLSLDHELVSSLRQQHALDLSAAQSQIRALENTVFDAEAKSHALRKQVSALEDLLAQTRSAVAAHRALSPSIPSTSRPASRAASVRTNLGAPPLVRSVFDQNLTPETRHKRKVSLSMLKARIDSEVAAHALAQNSRPPSRALSPVQSADGPDRPTSPPSRAPAPFHRPQFLDDSHVFWCHSCRGDLVIL
ncbi:hypothetical protein C8R45DRAFT_1058402 [Mycena sanguinolenta]|nr:hypothetical protein C8R45DRAFT_1058402 [Mycena sanguinolenta]